VKQISIADGVAWVAAPLILDLQDKRCKVRVLKQEACMLESENLSNGK
jgi:hypothetical protein